MIKSLFQPWRWRITTQLLVISVVPACLMLLFTNVYLYQAARDEVVHDVTRQARLIASSLAESSSYAVLSGNAKHLEKSLTRLVATQQGVQAIRIIDDTGTQVLKVGREEEGFIEAAAPVVFDQLNAETFHDPNTPHVSVADARERHPGKSEVVGEVRVSMSAEPIIALKRQRLLWATLLVLLFALGSGALGLAMALRLLHRPLKGFVNALQQIKRGDYDIPVDRRLRGEWAEIQRVICAMALALKTSQQALEQKVQQRTKELNEVLQLANEANEDKRRLINRGNDLIEEVRRSIAMEIHDSFNASIITVRLWTGAIIAKPNADPETVHLAQRIMTALDELYQSARHMIKQMHPEVLETLGLRAAIQEMVRTLDEAHPECEFTLSVDDDFPKVGGNRAIAVYRLVQEALSNVVKHAHASLTQVTLACDAAGLIRIVVEDNGRGFDIHDRANEGVGLIGMRERVSGAQGVLQIESGPQGTRIAIALMATPG